MDTQRPINRKETAQPEDRSIASVTIKTAQDYSEAVGSEYEMPKTINPS